MYSERLVDLGEIDKIKNTWNRNPLKANQNFVSWFFVKECGKMLQLVNVKGFLVVFIVFLQLFKIRVEIFQNKKLEGKLRMS